MNARKLELKELESGLKKLIIGCNTRLQNVTSVDEAQQVLLHLEEHDENFHRYAFVKMLRNCIEDAVGPLVDEEITDHSSGSNDMAFSQDAVVNIITSKVLESQAFVGLTEEVKRTMSHACENLLANYELEFPHSLSVLAGTVSRQDPHKQSEALFSDGESSVGDSSSGHSSVFFNSELQNQVAQNLLKKNSSEVRKSALRELSHFTGLLDVHSELWKTIRVGLLDALLDADLDLWRTCLNVFGRGFSSNSCNKDLYRILMEFLSSQFEPGTKHANLIPKVSQGINCKDTQPAKLLRTFRLVYEFQQQIPQRYPERSLDDILSITLRLFASYADSPLPGGVTVMSPLHFFALLDPKATWFVKLMHGHISRSLLLKLLEKHRSLVDRSVICVLEYANLWKRHSEEQRAGKSLPFAGESNRMVYSGSQLEFCYFVHSLSILSRLLLFEQGRRFFPVKLVKPGEGPVTLTEFLVTMIEMITRRPTGLTENLKMSEETFDPADLATDMLKKLCTSEEICHKCICQDAIFAALLAPIKHQLEDKQDQARSLKPPGELALVHVADLLSSIASSSCGRQYLLRGEQNDQQTAPIHVLAKFAKKAMVEESSSKAIVGSVIFVCRQFYSTCLGLLVLKQYQLHKLIYSAWRVANREAENASTPTPQTDDVTYPSPRNSSFKMQWEETLRDNLLNFACTPKGLLLLQQTGALGECISHMYSRYVSKLQVSKCEKFGYGYMMSQIACTAPGIVALENAGFITTLIRSLWGVLEVVDDGPVFMPKPWPVTPIDKTSKKPFTNLVNLLSSFPAVYEILGGKPLSSQAEYSIRQAPDSVVGILDRLVFVDTSAKIVSLFNYEQSHIFGLRLLSIMTCCLDTLLLLDIQYSFQEKLLSCQAENVTESKAIILDMLSMERNYILVKTYLIGGPSERIIPPRTLQMSPPAAASFQFPLFSSYPVPNEYIPSLSAKTSQKDDNELVRFLSETKKSELTLDWLERCRKVLISILSSHADNIRGSCLMDLVERVVVANCQLPNEAIFSTSDFSAAEAAVKNYKLTQIQLHGIQLAVRYGCHLKLLSSSKDVKDKLGNLIKKCTVYLQHQRTDCSGSWLQCLSANGSVGFDWFVATIFIMMAGNADRSWKFLYKFSSTTSSAFLWMNRIHCSVHLPQSLVVSGIPPVFFITCHNVEMILQMELPHVYSTFKMSGYSPAQICQHWIRQCFWNYLDWSQICHYVVLCLVLGADYQVYLCIAILRHLHRELMQQMQDKNLIVFIKEEPIRGFRIEHHMEYMQQLEKKFRDIVLTDMQSVAIP